MSPRARLALILCLTLLVLGGALGYTVARAAHWHEQGWTGVYYIFGLQAQQQAQFLGLKPGEVMLTASGSPADGRLLYRDEIVSLSGIPRDDTKRLAALDGELRRGSTIVYRVRRGDATFDVPLQLKSPLRSRYVLLRHVVAIVIALTFVAIGLLVVIRAPADTRATVFYLLALLSAVGILGGAATIYEQSNARGIVTSPIPDFTTVYLFTMVAMMYPPLILHLALIFPKRRPILDRHPIILRWIYAAAFVSVLSMLFTMVMMATIDFQNPARPSEGLSPLVRAIWNGSIIFGALVAVNVLWMARREGVKQAILRRPFRVSVATIGLLFGLAKPAATWLTREVAGVITGAAVTLPMLAIGTFPVFAILALYNSHRTANVEEKRQVAWPLWGLLIAIGAKVLGFIGGVGVTAWVTLTRQDMIAWRSAFETVQTFPTLATIAIPVSFAVAILKYRLMNIDVLLRKTVVYAILSGAIIVLYLGLVGVLGTVLVRVTGLQNSTMVIAATLVVALLFVPLRNRLQLLVDRNLFRHRYEYPEALVAISTESRTAADAGSFLNSVVEKLQRALQNHGVVLFLERSDEYVAAAKVGVADSLLGRLRLPGGFSSMLDRPFDPRRRVPDEVSSAALARIQTALVLPVQTRAFLAVSPKLSGAAYDVEDIDFLQSIAEQIGVGLNRIRMQAEEEDFSQAREIQQTLLPREMPCVDRLDVSGVWQPARTMGGDYYDLLPLSDSELAICIGDVAGKGMTAALTMSGLQAAVRASASSSPRDLCERVRRVVTSSLTGGRFVTFFYAMVDTRAMRLRWCNAGHNAPVLARADGTVVRLSEGGPAISRLFRSMPYSEREIELLPGDRIVLFTDGVSEATDETGEIFGETRIEDLVRRSAQLSAEELQQELVRAATTFSRGELEDDLTLVVVGVSLQPGRSFTTPQLEVASGG